MKNISICLAALLMLLVSCNNEGKQETVKEDSNTNIPIDSLLEMPSGPKKDTTTGKTYSNQRFKDVTVERMNGDSIRVRGRAQIFEASFGWLIEDGHNELKQGFTTADAGAPEWGNFDFTIHAKKERANSTLHLILFESSMKDGRRVHELSIPLL